MAGGKKALAFNLYPLRFKASHYPLTTSHLKVGAGKRIDDLQPLKPAEVAVSGDDLRDSVLEAESNNVSVMDQIAGGLCLANDLFEHRSVSSCFGEQKERRGS